MTILFKRAWEIIWENRRVILVLNGLYYGLILALMVYVVFDTPLQNKLLETNSDAYLSGALSLDHKSELNEQTIVTLGRTFLSNMLGVCYTEINLPSFFIPFVGIIVGLYRATQLGIAFSPYNPAISPIFLPHIPTMLVEGQASILAMLGAYIHGRAMIWPSSTGQSSRWKAYIEGVRQSGSLYVFILPILMIASCYGVIEAFLLMK